MALSPRLLLQCAAALAALAVPVVAIESCALSGFERATDAAPGPDAAADAGSDAQGDGSDGSDGNMGCTHTTYPDPPAGTDLGDGGTFVAAMRSIEMGETASAPLGLDLDGLCTCEGQGASCKSATKHCDGPGGIDNAGQGLFKLFSSVQKTSFGSAYFSMGSETGNWSLLMQVKGYNGKSDDDKVELDWYIPTRFGSTPDGGGTNPAWDGQDQWPISTASLKDPAKIDTPLYADLNAYVSGGVIVASLPDAQIVLSGGTGRIVLRITAGFVVAKVAKVAVTGGDGGTAWSLVDGTLVGRWRESDIFASLSSYRDNNGAPFCSGNFAYDAAKSQFCPAADITASVGTPTAPCDSMSLGLGFQSFPAELGKLVAPAPPLPGCPAATDPANDSCPP